MTSYNEAYMEGSGVVYKLSGEKRFGHMTWVKAFNSLCSHVSRQLLPVLSIVQHGKFESLVGEAPNAGQHTNLMGNYNIKRAKEQTMLRALFDEIFYSCSLEIQTDLRAEFGEQFHQSLERDPIVLWEAVQGICLTPRSNRRRVYDETWESLRRMEFKSNLSDFYNDWTDLVVALGMIHKRLNLEGSVFSPDQEFYMFLDAIAGKDGMRAPLLRTAVMVFPPEERSARSVYHLIRHNPSLLGGSTAQVVEPAEKRLKLEGGGDEEVRLVAFAKGLEERVQHLDQQLARITKARTKGDSEGRQDNRRPLACFRLYKGGECKFGAKCRYSHEKEVLLSHHQSQQTGAKTQTGSIKCLKCGGAHALKDCTA